MNGNTLAIAVLILGAGSAWAGSAAHAATTLAVDGSGAPGSRPPPVVPETLEKRPVNFDRAGLRAQLAASLLRAREQAAAVGREIAARAVAELAAGPPRPMLPRLEQPAADPSADLARPTALGAP